MKPFTKLSVELPGIALLTEMTAFLTLARDAEKNICFENAKLFLRDVSVINLLLWDKGKQRFFSK